MKLLVIRFSSIGDIVLTTPVFRCIKQQIPNAEIHLLTKRKFRAVSEGNLHISKLNYFKDDLKEVIDNLKTDYLKSPLLKMP